jgi:hypothetical protein
VKVLQYVVARVHERTPPAYRAKKGDVITYAAPVGDPSSAPSRPAVGPTSQQPVARASVSATRAAAPRGRRLPHPRLRLHRAAQRGRRLIPIAVDPVFRRPWLPRTVKPYLNVLICRHSQARGMHALE